MKQTNLTFLKTVISVGHLGLFFGLISIANLSTGIGPLASAAAEPRKQQTRSAYRAEIDAMISENGVPCKVATDCDAVPLGVKPCGGPLEFLILSKATKSKISDGLTDLTKTINEMDTLANAQSGAMGTCQAMTKPELACNAGNCVKGSAKK